MTQAEMEAEFTSLRSQILRLQRQQEGQKQHWSRWGVITACSGIALSIVSTIFLVITVGVPTPPIVPILEFSALQIFVLTISLALPDDRHQHRLDCIGHPADPIDC